MTCLINEVKLLEDSLRPILIQFQNGKLEKGEERKLRSGVYRDGRNKMQSVVATKGMVYTGNVNKENDFFNNFLVVHNRNTGKVKLIAMDDAILAPKINQKAPDVVDAATQNLNKSTTNELNKQFGSKRTKRITEQKERLQMDIDNVKEQLEETVAGVNVDESELFTTQVDETTAEYQPPIYRDASSKEEVYPINELIPENIMSALDVQLETILNTEDLNDQKLSPFIKMKIEQLKFNSGDGEKIKILLYVNYLITFITTNARTVSYKKFTICETSKDVNDYVLNNFSISTSTGRTRPFSMRDKAVCYILVLSMIACDYELEVEGLAKDLKLGLKKIQDMGRVLGFSPASKNKNVLVLKIPVPPAVSLSARNKRKR